MAKHITRIISFFIPVIITSVIVFYVFVNRRRFWLWRSPKDCPIQNQPTALDRPCKHHSFIHPPTRQELEYIFKITFHSMGEAKSKLQEKVTNDVLMNPVPYRDTFLGIHGCLHISWSVASVLLRVSTHPAKKKWVNFRINQWLNSTPTNDIKIWNEFSNIILIRNPSRGVIWLPRRRGDLHSMIHCFLSMC